MRKIAKRNDFASQKKNWCSLRFAFFRKKIAFTIDFLPKFGSLLKFKTKLKKDLIVTIS